MKLFIPAVGYRIRLTSDWTFKLYYERRNVTLLEKVVPGFLRSDNPYVNGNRREGLKQVTASFPAGTVLEIDRVYVRTMSKTAQSAEEDYDSVTFKVLTDNNKKLRFWAKLSDVNEIEYELPPNHAAAKEAAKENAKKPKKLTKDDVKELVRRAIYAKADSGYRKIYGKPPAWLTDEVVKDLQRIANEYRALEEPYRRKCHDDEVAKRRIEVEHALKTGTLQLPVAVASKVKTVDDVIEFAPERAWGLTHAFAYDESRRDWPYVSSYCVMSGWAKDACVYAKMPDGAGCRTFRNAVGARHPDYFGNVEPDFSHFWIKVYTNAEGTEIVKVEAGIDERKP